MYIQLICRLALKNIKNGIWNILIQNKEQHFRRVETKDYEDLIKSCRQGVNLTLEEIHSINETITPLVKKGQTTNHLYINHPDILDFSKSSFYHYIKDGIFEFVL